jgi:hypothetical protein
MSRELLERFAAGYLEEVAALSYRRLADHQSPPYASIGCGAAGIAYALWRASRALERPELLETARRWIDEAAAARARRGAFSGGAFTARDARGSVFYGPDGIELVAALVHQALGDQRRARAALSRFARAASAGGPPELLQGSAGYLSGASLLAAWLPGAARLEAALLRSLAGSAPASLLGMAHGTAGACFALLHACQRRGRAAPPAVRAALDRLASAGVREGRGMRWPTRPDGTGHHGGWCRGSAGFALLWAKAHEVTGEARFATLARKAAIDACDSFVAVPDLCCGAVGSAYAMLGLARIDPGRGWRRRAMRLALTALASETQTEWAHGLLKGEAGTFCLALDLLSGETRFPCLEA